MYEELIEKMRCCSDQYRCGDCRFVEDCAGEEYLLDEAADTIEELNRRIGRAIELYNRNVEKSAMYEALAGISPEPLKDEV